MAFQWDVADLVDDQQRIALEPPEFVIEGVAVLRLVEAVDPLLRGGKRDAVAGWQARMASAIARCVLPVPGE